MNLNRTMINYDGDKIPLHESDISKNKLQPRANTYWEKLTSVSVQLFMILLLVILLTTAIFAFTLSPKGGRVPHKGLLYELQILVNSYSVRARNAKVEHKHTSSPGPDLQYEKVISCYYNMPGQNTTHQLMPHNIDPYLCTHINLAFARVVDKKISLDPFQYKFLPDIIQLKLKNPKLKILLSVGGAGQDNGFTDMVVDHASRKIFIKSIKKILRNNTLDGIDLDWEFPAMHNYEKGQGSRERQHFSQLLREIRVEYQREKRDYLLTVAAAAPETIVNIAYDVDQLNMYVDFVNIMGYDFHFFSKVTPFTGLNSPLFARPEERLYLATLNINYTVHMYMQKGLDKNKIVVGIPTYGHSFTLVNADNNRVGAPASGYGSLGALGFVNYPEICAFINTYRNDVTIKRDDAAKVPYLYRSQEWVSYDTSQSLMEKAEYIKDNKLRGAMIYSLNADDYEGVCADLRGDEKFPLSQSVKNTLIGNEHE